MPLQQGSNTVDIEHSPLLETAIQKQTGRPIFQLRPEPVLPIGVQRNRLPEDGGDVAVDPLFGSCPDMMESAQGVFVCEKKPCFVIGNKGQLGIDHLDNVFFKSLAAWPELRVGVDKIEVQSSDLGYFPNLVKETE